MKKFFSVLFISIVLIPVCLLNANILNVPGNYPTIQSAINAAVNGDTVLVAPGTYFENINFRGKGILLTSFFINNFDTSYISNTIINGSTPLYPDTASCVIMTKPNISYANDSTAGIFGFTLTGGRGTLWEDSHFPGYFYREGGGIFIQYWSPRIRYNRIIANTIKDTLHPGGGGGGIRCCDGNPLIQNNVIQYNFGYCGMAINLYFSSGILKNNIIAGNYGGNIWGSGSVYTYSNLQSKPIIIENNTVVNNTATNGCGGLRLYNANYITAKNNIVWGNLPSQLYISGCTPSISYCDIQGGYTGVGNINLTPQFITNTFYLNSASPCIDAGDTSVSCNDPQDSLHPGLALWPAQGTIRNDMGVFGGPLCAVIGSSVIGIKNYGSNPIITDFILSQNYPNPFNPVTTISYYLPVSGFVEMKIFDIIGKEIRTLVQSNQNRGAYTVIWDGKDNSGKSVASGFYIYNMQFITQNQNLMKSRKMLLLK